MRLLASIAITFIERIMESEKSKKQCDPCAEFGPTQRSATVWFFCAILVGASLTVVLSQIDRFNYDTKGRYLDYSAYKNNRKSSTTIPFEQIDERKEHSSVNTVKSRLIPTSGDHSVSHRNNNPARAKVVDSHAGHDHSSHAGHDH